MTFGDFLTELMATFAVITLLLVLSFAMIAILSAVCKVGSDLSGCVARFYEGAKARLRALVKR